VRTGIVESIRRSSIENKPKIEVFVLTWSPDSAQLKKVGAEPVSADALDAAAVKAATQPLVAESNHLTTLRAQWATLLAASSIAATVTSGCPIMLG
jgi:hypothetical protein